MPCDAAAGEVTELLQVLIRNQCVNDGDPESGHEDRSTRVLETYLEGSGLDLQVYRPRDDRSSLVARIDGTDPDAPSLCLMGHTDVVPVSPEGWREDPFGGEVIDGEVWGRGAVDMLNLTASMAVAVRRLARQGFRPKGDLVFLAVADEESGGKHGIRWLIEHAWDAIGADYVLTESGGLHAPSAAGDRVTVTVAEKGVAWRRIRVPGTPAHGSMPLGSDNALVKAAEVVRRLSTYRPAAIIGEVWRSYVDAMVEGDLHDALLDPAGVFQACTSHPNPAEARYWHACTHTTFSPNVATGGTKTNIIPDAVDLEVDIRTVPGETDEAVARHLRAALGDLYDEVEIGPLHSIDPTESPVGTPMWDVLQRQVEAASPGSRLLPRIAVGASDGGWLRRQGVVAYGCGLMSPNLSQEEYASRFHGHDERVDIESLVLCRDLWDGVTRDLLG